MKEISAQKHCTCRQVLLHFESSARSFLQHFKAKRRCNKNHVHNVWKDSIYNKWITWSQPQKVSQKIVMKSINQLINTGIKEVKRILEGSLFTVSWSNWNFWIVVFVARGNPENLAKKNPWSKDKNQQQTQPICHAASSLSTWVTLVD